jgi:hypothetical protein
MKFDPSRLQDSSMNQLVTALIAKIGEIHDNGLPQDPLVRMKLCDEALAITFQLSGRVLGRSLPEE